MNTIKTLLLSTVLILMFCVNFSNSAINVTPAVPATGESITVTISNTLIRGAISIEFQVDFGDGSAPVSSPAYTTPGTNSYTVTHTYSRAGNFTIRGVTTINLAAVAPLQSFENIDISIVNPLNALPVGIVGEEYDHEIAAKSSPRTDRYRLIRGKLPPFLELEKNGRLTGIPAQKGRFDFTLEISTAQGRKYTRVLTLYIDPGMLALEVSPNSLDFTVGGVKSQTVTFRVVAPTVKINETIRSSRGAFLAGNKVLGYFNRPLNINLNTAQPSASETVSVPASVLQAAQQSGTMKLTYIRKFTAKNLNPGSGRTAVSMRTGASGELRITKLRIFFEQNNRPIILVERNSRELTGAIEIHYNGSGTFKGYWKVDERIIERVQKNIFYGKVMTLTTPNVPQLPTFSEGSHRLQFIITEPQTALVNIDPPEAIYHVEAKEAALVVPITLTAPENWAEIGSSGTTFVWTDTSRGTTYYLEFFEEDSEEPFFTAYTAESSYALLPRLLSMKFTEGKTFSWQVRGFNKGSELTGKSGKRKFTLAAKAKQHTP